MRATRAMLALALLLVGAACSVATAGSDGSGAYRSRARRDLITLAEIEARGQYSNLYDLIFTLRPRWLRNQGPDTFMGTQGQVQVHMDGNRMGSVAVLRRLSPSGVTFMQWLGPIDAAARFGLNHGHGVIIISTAPVH